MSQPFVPPPGHGPSGWSAPQWSGHATSPAGPGQGAGPGAYAGPAPYAGGGPQELRHPQDPEVRTSSKAVAVLVLGIAGLLLMFCVGGVAPAVLALAMARGARAELRDAQGFLGGAGMLRAGVVMSWIALGVSLVVLAGFVIAVLLYYGANPQPEFDSGVD
jgi:hypothetical protein